MKINIKMVKSLDGKYGQTSCDGKTFLIELAKDKTEDNLQEFMLTLLHEFLHIWGAIAKANKADIDRRQEHRFIYAVERSVTRLVNTHYRRKHASR